ncbi:MAG: UDP-N-acetylglucosamine 1-carboxyvinyltransferase [Candidatus Kerfeldbacteria bacterium]|nr:UDP-N-acetylglucosamine 1-carboxyvinyltransferase [Candidatus Kerfeldbacteria bacterium]
MDSFIIRGGQQIEGEISVRGAKNHAIKMFPASLLSREPVVLRNVPDIEDIRKLTELIHDLGGTVARNDAHTYTITAPETCDGVFPPEIVTKLRASIVMLGPVLARYGEVTMPYPGGDNLGPRPIDLFLSAFEKMGATITERNGAQHFAAPHGLRGANIVFPVVSVTGTETVMLAATLATGTTIIENAAIEPEVIALAEYLRDRGAEIQGIGTHTLTIRGGELLAGGECTIIPDRIEAGSFVMLAAAAAGHVRVSGCRPKDLAVPLSILQEMGVPLYMTDDSIEVAPHNGLRAHSLVTHEYPGFPTDLQAPMTVLLTQAHGESRVRETIYDGRLLYTDMLNSMGARITLLDAYRAVVSGATPLHGTLVVSPDIRAGIAMVIAGIIATKGTTTIEHVYHIDRGYEHIETRLQHINAYVERV